MKNLKQNRIINSYILGYSNLHLHVHTNNYIEYNQEQRENGVYRNDMGVDANNYMPVSVEEIIKFFLKMDKDEQQ